MLQLSSSATTTQNQAVVDRGGHPHIMYQCRRDSGGSGGSNPPDGLLNARHRFFFKTNVGCRWV
jgi:hypothetical protein